MFDRILEGAFWRLSGLLQALPIDVIFPAMIGAPNTILLNHTVKERGPSVGASFQDESVSTLSVFEDQ